ncbi:MAG: M23 family metallopeptidase [Aggregatilineales bacterium]
MRHISRFILIVLIFFAGVASVLLYQRYSYLLNRANLYRLLQFAPPAIIALAGLAGLLLAYRIKFLRRFIPVIIGITIIGGGIWTFNWYQGRFVGSDEAGSNILIYRWLIGELDRDALINDAVQCPDAPFMLPSSGLIGLLWSDPAPPYTLNRRHTGLDIFGAGVPGAVPIYAAYDGWLTRKAGWRSAVAIRHDDPLQPGRTIWTYYTHMANLDGSMDFIHPEFVPGTFNLPVKKGELIGYQGVYAGNAPPIAMHLHFSIALAATNGEILNESILSNTLDPSPYLGLPVNINDDPERPLKCLSSG